MSPPRRCRFFRTREGSGTGLCAKRPIHKAPRHCCAQWRSPEPKAVRSSVQRALVARVTTTSDTADHRSSIGTAKNGMLEVTQFDLGRADTMDPHSGALTLPVLHQAPVPVPAQKIRMVNMSEGRERYNGKTFNLTVVSPTSETRSAPSAHGRLDPPRPRKLLVITGFSTGKKEVIPSF